MPRGVPRVPSRVGCGRLGLGSVPTPRPTHPLSRTMDPSYYNFPTDPDTTWPGAGCWLYVDLGASWELNKRLQLDLTEGKIKAFYPDGLSVCSCTSHPVCELTYPYLPLRVRL